MRVLWKIIAVLTGLMICSGILGCGVSGRGAELKRAGRELIVCGGPNVLILELDGKTGPGWKKLWSWTARRADDLPGYMKGKFNSTDDCKSVNDGREILITSSAGGAALVERQTKKVRFWASVANAHSAELLPGGRIAVALSTAEDGNAIEIYDINEPEKKLYRDELYSAHGVVFDDGRQLLWALGYDELRAYELQDRQTAEPKLKRKHTFEIPGRGGHDLQAVPHSDELIITEEASVWLFDRQKGTFREHPQLAGKRNVKSVMVHPLTGRTVYVQAEENWWAYNIRFLNPAKKLALPGLRLYKARWVVRRR